MSQNGPSFTFTIKGPELLAWFVLGFITGWLFKASSLGLLPAVLFYLAFIAIRTYAMYSKYSASSGTDTGERLVFSQMIFPVAVIVSGMSFLGIAVGYLSQ
ncbi:MAG: hypothetical protein ACAH35_00475 [Candidatus Paceibacterota bacterium]